MKKDFMKRLVLSLPGRDAQLGLQMIDNRQFENLKEIVVADIKKLEQIEDETGQIEKQLAKLYALSDGIDDYIVIFDDIDYEEL